MSFVIVCAPVRWVGVIVKSIPEMGREVFSQPPAQPRLQAVHVIIDAQRQSGRGVVLRIVRARKRVCRPQIRGRTQGVSGAGQNAVNFPAVRNHCGIEIG